MKKVLIAAGIAALAFATVAGAQSYVFSTNLTVGSTGSDVSALQTWLMSSGYSIPSVASGAAAKGYFGSQTKAAVMAYQAAHGLPNTGFFGPLTRAAINGGAAVTTPGTTSVVCPVGYICTQTPGTTPTNPVVTSPAGITTPGVPGTLTFAGQSNYNNTSLDKGKSADVARFKAQASASDMAVSSLSLDFDVRLWLYASAITIKDDAGTVIVSRTGLSSADFSELTVGSKYRLTIPMNYVIPRTATRYFVVNVTALPISDRASANLHIVGAQVRAVDGTGVTDTEAEAYSANEHTIAYSGSSNANIVTTINSQSPSTKLVQISTSVETDNVVLGIFDIKSQNSDSTLRTLKVQLRTSGATVNTLFNTVKVRIAGSEYTASSQSAGATASSTALFDNLSINLPKDQYVSVTVLGKVAKNVSGTASTTLVANSDAIQAEDATYSTVSVSAAVITANDQTFTATGVVVPTLSTTYGSKTCSNDLTTCVQSFTYSFSLTAGDSPIYVAKDVFTALSTSTNPSGFTITKQDFSDSDTSGDGSTYFYLAPGQTKSFTAQFQSSASSTSGGTLQVTSINFGTSSGALAAGHLNSSDIQNLLKAVLFH